MVQISEVSDEYDNKSEFEDAQPESIDSDLAEQRLFISDNKTS